jgi:hypothetical protein
VNPEVLPWFATVWGVLVLLGGFIWHAAVTKTSHEHRIAVLERGHSALLPTIEELRKAVVKLDKSIAVSNARSNSQGAFDQGQTDPPGR